MSYIYYYYGPTTIAYNNVLGISLIKNQTINSQSL